MLSVRLFHVLAMAVVVGGAVLIWGTIEAAGGDSPPVRLAYTYEWLFWGAMGLLAMTGVGNLGALGRGLPGPGTEWGATLALKLGLVLAFVAFSAVRTLVVGTEPSTRALRRSYALTTVWLLGVLALAEVLAHG